MCVFYHSWSEASPFEQMKHIDARCDLQTAFLRFPSKRKSRIIGSPLSLILFSLPIPQAANFSSFRRSKLPFPAVIAREHLSFSLFNRLLRQKDAILILQLLQQRLG